VGGEQAGLMAGDQEYRSRGEREYARCRIAEYSLLRIAGVSLRGRRWEVEKENNLMPRGAILPFAKRYPFFCPRIYTDLHELAPGSPGFTVQNRCLFVIGKEFQDCRWQYNRIFVLQTELYGSV